MYLQLWSFVLAAFAAQCIFLMLVLLFKQSENHIATRLLLLLLSVFFVINASNLFTAIYLYHRIPLIGNLGRGMVLLIGPILYLYTQAILFDDFKVKWIHICHLLPYFIALLLIWMQLKDVSTQLIIATGDSLTQGKITMPLTATLWFVAYFIHVTFYALLTRAKTTNFNLLNQSLIIPFKERLAWIKKMMVGFWMVAAIFVGITGYILITGYYAITGNFIYTTALGVMIYLVAYQAISNKDILKPDFRAKYNAKIFTQHDDEVYLKLLHLLIEDKIFLESDLNISRLAELLNVPSYSISRIINEKTGKNFNELINYHRISEVKSRLAVPKYAQYSLMGIAYDVGYKNKSSFNTAFKKQTGVTPSIYLRSII